MIFKASVIMASYHASNFEDLFLEKISDLKPRQFVILRVIPDFLTLNFT